MREFYWIIKLKNLNISFNGERINPNEICEEYTKKFNIKEKLFEINLIRWKKDYCKDFNSYYIDSLYANT